MGDYPIVDKSTILALLDAQYGVAASGRMREVPSFAAVNAVIALAIHAGELAVDAVAATSQDFYRNAALTIPDMISSEPTLLSVRALLAMAMLARNLSKAPAFYMLAATASRQLGLLQLRYPEQFRESGSPQRLEYWKLYRIACTFEELSSSAARS